MKVRARAVNSSEISDRVEPYTRQTFTTAGKEYEVHAVAVFDNGIPFFQFVDDLGYPSWKPSLLFEVSDGALPTDWICNPLSTKEGESILLLGPDFIVVNEEAYNAMVELDANQVERFWRRVGNGDKKGT
jgi:hypothetical protein